jgi:hypothetical protein
MPVSYKALYEEEEPQVIGPEMIRKCIEVLDHVDALERVLCMLACMV